ncbi:MAG: COR domain-containing protein [Cyanobacteria bacterium P01_G01_bin.54]
MARDEAYHAAERKIAEALRTGATELDLSCRYDAKDSEKLTELPELLDQLTQLQELHLSWNKLTELPDSLGQLPQLQELNLSDNQLTELPESLGQLTQLQELNLSENQLTELPESLGQLTQLQELNLSNNQLTELPESLAQLTQLRSLNVGWNNDINKIPNSIRRLKFLETLQFSMQNFSSIPEWISELQFLRILRIDGSKNLCDLPDSIAKLKNLETLYLGYNVGCPLKELPKCICSLEKLRKLRASGCKLKNLPDWIGLLYNLEELHIPSNAISELPYSLTNLQCLRDLNLNNNPLNPELAAAYEKGLDAVKAYLREKAKGTRQRYEAKLLILGDGNEGKTCVSRALRGLPFAKQTTTRGVDVEPWTVPHPDHPNDEDRQITLNLWDFEGQEINHQTHQFFLSTDSLYVLVFKCRDQFLLDRAEYWLDTIRSRAPDAQVAIVITECEQRTPYIPQDRLLAEYSDLLTGDPWLFAVGCEDNSGIEALQQALQHRAADLPFMGREWPQTYEAAENQIKQEAEATSHVTRRQLHEIFADSNIDAEGYEEAARSLARLGYITQFEDCPDLTDFIVLQPQWLTTAISYVMEDGQLATDQGEITFERMEQIWAKQCQAGMFSIFHNCMKEFELCYDLENYNDRCLVPLRFGYRQPTIPWKTSEHHKIRRVAYRLNLRPPTGLMSRFIVKTNHMIVQATAEESSTGRRGVYWHNGVFLQSGEGPLLSQALCQFNAEQRTLSIEVRAAFPQKMLDQIDAYVRAVFAFFEGLKPERSYGCIIVDETSQAEIQCPAFHTERKILFAIQNRRPVACEEGWHDVDPMLLITGISSFGGDIKTIIREEHERTRASVRDESASTRAKFAETLEPLLQNMGTLLNWADQHQQILQQLQDDRTRLAPEIRQELELKLREYLGHMSNLLDERQQKSAPSLFSIGTQDGKPWDLRTCFHQTYVLTPWCEYEGKMHRHDAGQVTFKTDREWWAITAPVIARGTKLLATGLNLAFAGMPMALGDEVYGTVKNDVIFMKELTKHLTLDADPYSTDNKTLLNADDWLEGDRVKDLRGDGQKTALMRTAMAQFLEAVAPKQYHARQWGGLKRIHLPDNSYRWLCEEHAREARR